MRVSCAGQADPVERAARRLDQTVPGLPARAGWRAPAAPRPARRDARSPAPTAMSKMLVRWNERATPSRGISQGGVPVMSRPSRYDAAGGRLDFAGQQIDERGLAGAVRADHGVQLCPDAARRRRRAPRSGRRSDVSARGGEHWRRRMGVRQPWSAPRRRSPWRRCGGACATCAAGDAAQALRQQDHHQQDDEPSTSSLRSVISCATSPRP